MAVKTTPVKFITREFFPHDRDDEKTQFLLEEQKNCCHGCGIQVSNTEGNSGFFSSLMSSSSSKSLKFCHYTGHYYCTKKCFTNKKNNTHTLPSKVLYCWDFTPYPVCDAAYDYLEEIWAHPVVCVSAINPTLFDRVLSLRVVRHIRVQIYSIFEACRQCHGFQTSVVDSIAAAGNDHLITGTEMYSMSNLESLKQCPIVVGGDKLVKIEKHIVERGQLVMLVKEIRSACVQHVLHLCKAQHLRLQQQSDQQSSVSPTTTVTSLSQLSSTFVGAHTCYDRCVAICPGCNKTRPEDRVFLFDTVNTKSCRFCETVYHKDCFVPNRCGCGNVRKVFHSTNVTPSSSFGDTTTTSALLGAAAAMQQRPTIMMTTPPSASLQSAIGGDDSEDDDDEYY
eukprot:PhF_6_TR6962/c0_g1_i4/m.10273/K19330/RUBCN; run domain Beclin-1 interacting and cysteine-rich containing protein